MIGRRRVLQSINTISSLMLALLVIMLVSYVCLIFTPVQNDFLPFFSNFLTLFGKTAVCVCALQAFFCFIILNCDSVFCGGLFLKGIIKGVFCYIPVVAICLVDSLFTGVTIGF